MDIIVGAHLYDTRHKNIQVIVFLFFCSIYWCEAHLKSTDMFLIILEGLLLSVILHHSSALLPLRIYFVPQKFLSLH